MTASANPIRDVNAAGRPNLGGARFYAILDTAYVPRHNWMRMCQALIEGGASLVQVRAKNETSGEREDLLRQVLPLFFKGESPGATRPLLMVNDDVGLCARYPGVGLHVGQEDTPPEEARKRIGPHKILGLSTHSFEQATRAERLPHGLIDYFCVGPVFPTQTKPDYVPVGLELVREVAGSNPRLPWFAIGGITRANVHSVVTGGVRRVVVVSDVLKAASPAQAIRDLLASLGPE